MLLLYVLIASGAWVGAYVRSSTDWDSDSDSDSDADSRGGSDSDSNMSASNLAKRAKRRGRPVVGLIHGVSDDGLFYKYALDPDLDAELEESEVRSRIVLKAPSMSLTLGCSSLPVHVHQGCMIELTKEGAMLLCQPQHSLWQCKAVWLGQEEAVYLELHAVSVCFLHAL